MSDKAGSTIRETISAMMDNETSEFECYRGLKALDEDAELRETWHRYHLASSVMGGDLPSVSVDLSAQIAIAIEAEPDIVMGTDMQRSRGRGSLRKLAIAASVAVVAVFGMQNWQSGLSGVSEANPALANVQAPVDQASANVGPQFQMPPSFAYPQLNARTFSTASFTAQQHSSDKSSRNIEVIDTQAQQIQSYLQRMMHRHANQGVSTLPGVQQVQAEQ